jgi:DnaJ-class molecular chaperone
MGSGYVPRIVRDHRSTHLFQEECSVCDARGFFLPMRVVVANIEVEIPAGAVDGYQVIVEGAADDERPFRLPGDLSITCKTRRTGGGGADRSDSERGAGAKIPLS